MDILERFKKLDTHEKIHGYYEGDFPIIDKQVAELNEMLAPLGLTLYYHHDEYCWTSWFINTIGKKRDGV